MEVSPVGCHWDTAVPHLWGTSLCWGGHLPGMVRVGSPHGCHVLGPEPI